MPLMRLVRLFEAGIVAMVLATAGCPSSGDKPDTAEPQVSTPKPPPTKEPVATTLPAAEFHQAPALPPSKPLPKPAQESLDQPIGQPSAILAASTNVKPAEPSNPLRELDESSAKNPALRMPDKPLRPPIESVAPKIPEQKAQPPVGRPQTKKNSGIPFDPIKENGPIFVGWPKPKAVLIITGMEEGYLEPCGCAGLDRMKGGMGRRATLFQQLRQQGWPVVGLDVGGLVQGFGRQVEMKFQTTVEGKLKMGYGAIAFGTEDLRLPGGNLLAVADSVHDKSSPFIAANVGVLSKAGENTLQSRIIEAGGIKIGVTAILGKTYQKEIHNDEIEMSDPESILTKIVPELKQKAQFLVLLAHATKDESVTLGKKFPAFNVVVSADGWPEPPKTPETIDGTKTLLITVGHKGMNAIVLGLFDGDPSLRYERVPLDSRFPSSPDMKMLMAAYQEQLKMEGFAKLGLRPVPHPLLETNGKFIGAQKCASCHEKSYDVWKKSGHAHAYEALVKLDPPRNFDPECVSCHVVGWHPTKFFPYDAGYSSQDKTPHLVNVGCEDCHGPGEKHAAAELSGSEGLRAKLRKAMVVTKADAKKQQCVSCHDLDNSKDFDFDLYWPFVEHHEKE